MKNFFLSITLALFALCAVGCSSTYKQTVLIHNSASPLRDGDASALVIVPADGVTKRPITLAPVN